MLQQYLQEQGDVNGPAGLEQWGMEAMGSGCRAVSFSLFFFFFPLLPEVIKTSALCPKEVNLDFYPHKISSSGTAVSVGPSSGNAVGYWDGRGCL